MDTLWARVHASDTSVCTGHVVCRVAGLVVPPDIERVRNDTVLVVSRDAAAALLTRVAPGPLTWMRDAFSISAAVAQPSMAEHVADPVTYAT